MAVHKAPASLRPRFIQSGSSAVALTVYHSTLSLTLTLGGVNGQRHATENLPREKPGTHCIGGWVELMTVLDGCGKSRLHRDSIPGQTSL
jgi:hypothetical protein